MTVYDYNGACAVIQIQVDPFANSLPARRASGDVCERALFYGNLTAYYCNTDTANGVASCANSHYPPYKGTSANTLLGLMDGRLDFTITLDTTADNLLLINNRAVYQYGFSSHLLRNDVQELFLHLYVL